jgi:hypothetical protein
VSLFIKKQIKKSASTALWCVICLTCFVPTALQAHLDGASFEEEKEGYLIDIGYEPELLVATEQIRLDFKLSTEEMVDPFTDVWVYVEKNGVVYFSGGIHESFFGPTGLTLVLPEAGNYIVSARFQNNGILVVETEFPIVVGVTKAAATDTRNTAVVFFLALLLGIGLGYLFRLYIKSVAKN